MLATIKLPRLPQIAQATKGGADDFILFGDLEDFVASVEANLPKSDLHDHYNSWYNASPATALNRAKVGNDEAVAKSTALMEHFNDVKLPGPAFRKSESVSGGGVNVGAYLAGNPRHMIRRERQPIPTAPLVIFADVIGSAAITAESMMTRGAAVLALVRLLASVRPVDLYVTHINDREAKAPATFTVIKVPTAPLDLARGGYLMADVSFGRGLGMPLQDKLSPRNGWGGWPYSNYELYRKNALEIYSRLVPSSSEKIYLAPPHVNDPVIKDPVRWVKDMLRQYGGADLLGE